jgi:hypothetical protein
MRGLRLGMAVFALGSAGLLTLGLIDCAEPTQIVVEVYSDACPGPTKTAPGQSINTTAISVGKPDGIDEKPPVAFREGCESARGVGTLTIYPSGANDDEVAIKVVGGVESTPDRCTPPGYAGCIAHRRVMRFIPNTTQRVKVTLSLACLNRTCLNGTTCDKGVCTRPEDLNVDGTTRPDASVEEAGITPEGGDAAPVDPCLGCKGKCMNGACTVNCGTDNCDTTDNLCAPTLPCTITCPDTNKCKNILCATSAKCTVSCGDKQGSCGRVTCTSNECSVVCNGQESCNTTDGGIVLDAGTKARLECKGDNACTAASCNAPICELYCNPGGGPKFACPPLAGRPCTTSTATGCQNWTTPLQ